MESVTTTILNTQLKGVLFSDGTQHSPDIKRIQNEVYTCIMFAILHVCYLLLFVYMLMGQMAYYMNKVSIMTKMAAMPIYGKNLKNLLLQNQKSYDLTTWHVASGSQALPSLYK